MLRDTKEHNTANNEYLEHMNMTSCCMSFYLCAIPSAHTHTTPLDQFIDEDS